MSDRNRSKWVYDLRFSCNSVETEDPRGALFHSRVLRVLTGCLGSHDDAPVVKARVWLLLHAVRLKREGIILINLFRSFHFSRWKSPENEWRQQPWDVQTIPTIVRLRDVSTFSSIDRLAYYSVLYMILMITCSLPFWPKPLLRFAIATAPAMCP